MDDLRPVQAKPGEFSAYSVPFNALPARYRDPKGRPVEQSCVVFAGVILKNADMLPSLVRPIPLSLQDRQTGKVEASLMPDAVCGVVGKSLHLLTVTECSQNEQQRRRPPIAG